MALPEIGSSSSSPISGHTYDVYSNFRGTDNRYSFTEHLNKALVDANFTTFFSDEKIEIKEGLKPDLESAIKASRASVIVLSKNFATSAWFLEELVQILEQRMTSNHIVVPIYYRIEPTEVEKVHRTFREELARILHEMKFVTDTSQWALQMDRKGKALAQLADLRGILVNDAVLREKQRLFKTLLRTSRIDYTYLQGVLCHKTRNFIQSQTTPKSPYKP